jgi:hypothetical protein
MVKAEKGLLHTLGHAVGRGRGSTQPSSAIFGVQTGALALNRQRTGVGEEDMCNIKQSLSKCGLIDYFLSSGSPRVPEEFSLLTVLTWGEQTDSYDMITPVPGYSLITGNCLHWEKEVYLSHKLCCSLKVVLIPWIKMLLVGPVLPGTQGDCKVTAENTA